MSAKSMSRILRETVAIVKLDATKRVQTQKRRATPARLNSTPFLSDSRVHLVREITQPCGDRSENSGGFVGTNTFRTRIEHFVKCVDGLADLDEFLQFIFRKKNTFIHG